ncbi:MAG: polyprenyl synthetase family protein [Candidatus Pacearchaeota archaeon]|nr:polyprenyl synthetase family protein [Candidatus Pacearchaeota archaeon]
MMEIKELYELFDKLYENEVKPYIENRIARNRHTEPVYYILDNFKLRRFRGAFPIIISELYNQNRALVLPIAAASELVFCIALVQDDIIDDDEKRGEIIASHIKYGIGKCLASCDYIYALIIKMLKELENQKINPEIINIVYESFIEAHERLYKSFLDEKNEANNFKLSEEEILETYKNKTIQGTNALFCAILLCTENKDLANLIKEYSYKLAIAGQIKNDIYDATSYLINRGYSDLENGYVTYIIKKLINSFPETEREGIIEIIKNKDHDKIIKILNDKGIITLCIQDCNKFVEEAISLIKGRFPKRLEEIFLVWAEGNRKFSRKI